jgi:hypothetical protein
MPACLRRHCRSKQARPGARARPRSTVVTNIKPVLWLTELPMEERAPSEDLRDGSPPRLHARHAVMEPPCSAASALQCALASCGAGSPRNARAAALRRPVRASARERTFSARRSAGWRLWPSLRARVIARDRCVTVRPLPSAGAAAAAAAAWRGGDRCYAHARAATAEPLSAQHASARPAPHRYLAASRAREGTAHAGSLRGRPTRSKSLSKMMRKFPDNPIGSEWLSSCNSALTLRAFKKSKTKNLKQSNFG